MLRFEIRLGVAFGLLAGAVVAAGTGPADLVNRVKTAGAEARGSAETAAAWAELSRQDASALPAVLAGLDAATPVGANWLVSAADAIAARAKAAGKSLPAKDLEAFLKDTSHSGPARRLAFDLLCQADAGARDRLLSGFLDDPGFELRFEAVQSAFDKAAAKPKDDADATAELKRLLATSRHFEQTEAIAKELDARKVKVDLTDHFGFLKHWRVLAAFDNTGGKGYRTAYPIEAKNDLSATPGGKGNEPTRWLTTDSAEQYGSVDLNKLVGKLKDAVVYAVAVVESPEERDVEFRAGSATAIKIFVNGQELFARESYHQDYRADTHAAAGRLRKGRNVVMLKICQNNQTEPWAQDWKFQFRITDKLGAKVPCSEVTSE